LRAALSSGFSLSIWALISFTRLFISFLMGSASATVASPARMSSMMAVSSDRTSSTFFGSLPFNLTTWRFASLARHIAIRFRKARPHTE